MRLTRDTGCDVVVVDTFHTRTAHATDIVRALGSALPGLPLVRHADADYRTNGQFTCAVAYRGPTSTSELCHSVQRLLVARTNGAAAGMTVVAAGRGTDAVARLTTREREVLAQVTSGHWSKAIVRSMRVSLRTVESHRARIFAKLGVRTIPELTKVAPRAGLGVILGAVRRSTSPGWMHAAAGTPATGPLNGTPSPEGPNTHLRRLTRPLLRRNSRVQRVLA